jgi:hypothetical protein
MMKRTLVRDLPHRALERAKTDVREIDFLDGGN